MEIRKATSADVEIIHDFILQLADYEQARAEVLATAQDIRDSLFSPDSNFHAIVCARAGKAIGFAVYFYSFSTWLGKPCIYLEDLFVEATSRGCGAGTALLRFIAREAVVMGCGRLEWSVLDWNKPSIAFYESIGAKPQSEWVRYRLAGESLAHFAASDIPQVNLHRRT